MVMTNLKTSVAFLAISGCAAEGVPASVAPDAGAPGREDAGGTRRGPGAFDAVSDLLAIVVCTAMSLAGCDGGSDDLVPDAGLLDTQVSTDVLRTDTIVAPDTGKLDTIKSDAGGYTPNGVTANLGANPCQTKPECLKSGVRCGWDPATNKCYDNNPDLLNTNGHMPGICDETKWCTDGSLPPGTLMWTVDARHTYLGDSSGGYVCLPIETTWCPAGGCCSVGMSSGCRYCTN